ncbi:MAG: hypothetical protein ABSA53_27265 [Streptosporangiaceae bacterium]|jgi:hypothetical protein
MASIKYEHRDLDVACTLGATQRDGRQAQWHLLREQSGLGTEPIPDGIRIWLRPQARALAESLARQEADCCGFLDLELASDGGRLRLDITSPAAEAAPVIAWLAGMP